MTTKTTRRAILAGAATLPALAVPALALSGNCISGPVFAAIERHRTAYAVHEAACDVLDNLVARLTDRHGELYYAEIPTSPVREVHGSGGWKGDDIFEYRSEYGKPTGEFYYAGNSVDIQKHAEEISKEHREAWIADRRGALAREKRRLRRLRIETGCDTEDCKRSIASSAVDKSRQELLRSVPTTFAGLHALVVYVHGANILDGDDPGVFLQTVSAALTSFVGRQAVQS